MGEKQIKAVNAAGLEGVWSEFAWEIGKPEKHGWRKIGVVNVEDIVETEEVDLAGEKVEIKTTKIPSDNDLYPSDDEIRAELKEKEIKFHPNLGTVKLRKLYDENTK